MVLTIPFVGLLPAGSLQSERSRAFPTNHNLNHRTDLNRRHSQFSILNSQFSILDSQFSILNSQFFIFHYSFFILHSSFFIFHFSFFILHSSFNKGSMPKNSTAIQRLIYPEHKSNIFSLLWFTKLSYIMYNRLKLYVRIRARIRPIKPARVQHPLTN